MNKKAVIEIILQSDLCVGSGYSYAGVIDSDVVSDRYGFPYIPARRLKGCMREAAEMIRVVLRTDTIAELFGRRGQKSPGRLILGNARIANYKELMSVAGQPAFYRHYSKDTILQQFTSVRTQTMIQAEGIAKDNTLRFIRVINQISPLSKPDRPENLTFYAEIIYPEEYEKDLAMIVQATRSIGMNRNRGLGNIHCELNVAEAQPADRVAEDISGDAARVEIRYILTNEEPLMISQDSDNVSATYIPGRVILGALAANYLGEDGSRADDPAFRDLFLDGSRTQFLNAYITDGRGERCIPVPGYIRRLKKSRHLVNYELVHMAPKEPDANAVEYGVAGGNQPKALTGKYCTIDKGHAIRIIETERQLTYHHRHQHGDEAVQLYSHLEVTEGQHFAGVIRTSAAYKELVISLLEQGFRIGKSRSAQYGQCVAEIKEIIPTTADILKVSKDDEVMVSFSSPAVILKNGQETIDYKSIYNQVARDLGINGKISEANGEAAGVEPFGIIDTRLIHGYQSVWNLRRTPVAAVSEGSVLVYHMKESADIDRNLHVGVMNLEGYGEIYAEKMVDMPYQLMEAAEKQGESSEAVGSILPELRLLIERIDHQVRFSEKMREIRDNDVQKILNPLTPAALGRITLMLREAGNGTKGRFDEQYRDYCERIKSIKTKSVRETAMRYAELCDPKKLGDLSERWSDIAMEGLICQKYLKKCNDGENKEQKESHES